MAVDVGGTTIKSALVNAQSEQLATARRATARELGPESVIRAVLDATSAAVSSGIGQFGQPPLAIGIACLGAVDEQAGVALTSGAIGWHDIPLRELVAKRTGLPVVLGHDLRAGALAEARRGAGKGHDCALFVAIGTGIGAAVVLGGQPYAGGRWRAGELGHIVVAPGGCECNCGGRGCLEAEASGTAIVKRYRAATMQDRTALEVVDLHRGGDPIATLVWWTTVSALAGGLCTAAAILDPDVIVIGGGVALAGDELFRPLREAMALQFRLGEPPPIVPAALGDTAACLGAGLLAWDLAGQQIGLTQ